MEGIKEHVDGRQVTSREDVATNKVWNVRFSLAELKVNKLVYFKSNLIEDSHIQTVFVIVIPSTTINP
jgi:hypothetical protein